MRIIKKIEGLDLLTSYDSFNEAYIGETIGIIHQGGSFTIVEKDTKTTVSLNMKLYPSYGSYILKKLPIYQTLLEINE